MATEQTTTHRVCNLQADVASNLIRIAYFGHVTGVGIKTCVEAFKALLPNMRPGFTVVADLSGLESMELDCVTGITQIMDACRDHSVSTVVRIIPDPTKDIGLNILGIVHYRSGVRVVTCHTDAEAARALKA